MANHTVAGGNEQPVKKWLAAVLGVVIVVAVIVAVSNKKEVKDPTLTAAPPIVSTPDHPIVIHKKSPEAMAALMQQDGMGPSASPPAAKH